MPSLIPAAPNVILPGRILDAVGGVFSTLGAFFFLVCLMLAALVYYDFQAGRLALFILFIGPVALSYYFQKWESKKNKRLTETINQKFEFTLDRIDYFRYNRISLDAVNREIAVLDGVDFEFKTYLTGAISPDRILIRKIKLENVIGQRAFAPGYSKIKGFGLARFDLNITVENVRVRDRAAEKTGLYLDIDDIVKPHVFLRMGYDNARKWLLILDKCANGTLGPQPQPLNYPTAE